MSSVDDCSSSHNYVNPPTRPPWVQATCIIYLVLVVGTLALRFYTRLRFGHRLGVDDLFAALATVCAPLLSPLCRARLTDYLFQVFAVSGYIIVLVMEQHYGFNRHSWDIPPAMYRTVVRLNWIYDELFVQAACQAKLSLLLFCWRLIGRAFQRIHYILVMSLIVFVVLCEIMFVIVSVLECRYVVPPQLAISRENPVADDRSPLKAIWDHHPDYHYSCFKIGYFLMIAGLINTVTDIACTLIPISVVLRLEMPLRQRFGVASVFLLGFIVNVASCLRIYYAYHQEIWGGDIWNQMQPFIASNSEIGLGLVSEAAQLKRLPRLTRYLALRQRACHPSVVHSPAQLRVPLHPRLRHQRNPQNLQARPDRQRTQLCVRHAHH